MTSLPESGCWVPEAVCNASRWVGYQEALALHVYHAYILHQVTKGYTLILHSPDALPTNCLIGVSSCGMGDLHITLTHKTLMLSC